MHYPNQNPNMKTWSVVADIRIFEGFEATFASAANPISTPVYGWIIEPFIDGGNYVKNVATPRLESKRIKYYRKYGIIK